MRGKFTPVQYSEEEIAASAAKFKHRNDWKTTEPNYYQAAHRRGLVDKVASHMVPQAHPYSGSYIVYAYEFIDRHVYVGLTFLPKTRHGQHMQRGPVHNHMQVCAQYTYKVIQDALGSPQEAVLCERQWITQYKAQNWQMLNEAEGGSLGTVQITKWTKEAILAEAKKYTTKQEWIDNSQMSYRLAKREGWFNEAAAHMPKRVLGIGAGRIVSKATRRKQCAAKLGKKLTQAHRESISESITNHWNQVHGGVVV
jgi:hypothetical protein